jgi:leucyl aminopeptidase
MTLGVPRISVATGEAPAFRADALILPLPEGDRLLRGAAKALDPALRKIVAHAIQRRAFRGKRFERRLLHPIGRPGVERLLLVGLGNPSGLKPDHVRRAAADALRQLRATNAATVAIACHDAPWGRLPIEATGEALAEGTSLGLYRFDRYKDNDDPDRARMIDSVTLLSADAAVARMLQRGVRRGGALASATTLARNLTNEPANVLTPVALAARAKEAARRYRLSVEVLDEVAMRRLGMGALLGVAQGTVNPPRLIILRHRATGRRTGAALGLVGKGVTFDAGGISIKRGGGVETMKADMAGAAAVLGAMMGIAALRVPIDVLGVIPAVENLPSGSAQRPGDIVRAMDGTTIEIISTDAEGRLILADALCYARRLGARRLVDVATLTGGVVVTLGSLRTGLFANDQALADQVTAASERAGEKVWQLPLDDEYQELLTSDQADLKNTGGGRKAPAIGAARFLKHFVGGVPWVHLDINGTALHDKESGYLSKGATGVMARTLIHLAQILGRSA